MNLATLPFYIRAKAEKAMAEGTVFGSAWKGTPISVLSAFRPLPHSPFQGCQPLRAKKAPSSEKKMPK